LRHLASTVEPSVCGGDAGTHGLTNDKTVNKADCRIRVVVADDERRRRRQATSAAVRMLSAMTYDVALTTLPCKWIFSHLRT